MKKILLASLFAACCFVLPMAGQEAWPTETTIRRLLKDCVEKQKRAPGIVVGIVDRNGPRIFSHGTFTADSTNAVNGDTVFEIGSISKAFTGMLLALAVERGDVKLDDSAQKFLPAAASLLQRDGKQITLLHLTTHTSGFPRLPDNYSPADPDNPYADYTVGQLYVFLGGCKLNSVPGEKYAYSNLGAGLLGHILALKAGTNYEALVRREICTPLKMDDTRITLTPGMKIRLAPGHNSAGVTVKNWDIVTLAGAGGLRSTANDMLKLIAANAGLTETTLTSALKKSHLPRHSAGGPQREVGLGWHIQSGKNSRYVWHNGATGGYHAFAGFDPEARRGVVVLANSANNIDDLGWHLLNTNAPVTVTPLRQAAKIDFKVYDRYAGNYKFPLAGELNIVRDGNRLFAKLDKQPPLEIFPESEAKFFAAEVNAQISFAKDAAGNVTHLILHQNGLDQKAVKVKPENRK